MRQIFVLFVGMFIFLNTMGQVVINEIMYNPPESGKDLTEFIELYNNGSEAVNLNGYTFSEGVNFTFEEVEISPGGFVVITADKEECEALYMISDTYEWSGALLNSGEALTLLDGEDGNVVDHVFYGTSGDWPSEANGQGYSIILCDATSDNADPLSWQKAGSDCGIIRNGFNVYASPGMANDCVATTVYSKVSDGLSVFPNPVCDELRINALGIVKVEIISVLGRVVLERYGDGASELCLSLAELVNGIYIVSVTLADGSVVSQKVVKK